MFCPVLFVDEFGRNFSFWTPERFPIDSVDGRCTVQISMQLHPQKTNDMEPPPKKNRGILEEDVPAQNGVYCG